jgi:hypothetical protein
MSLIGEGQVLDGKIVLDKKIKNHDKRGVFIKNQVYQITMPGCTKVSCRFDGGSLHILDHPDVSSMAGRRVQLLRLFQTQQMMVSFVEGQQLVDGQQQLPKKKRIKKKLSDEKFPGPSEQLPGLPEENLAFSLAEFMANVDDNFPDPYRPCDYRDQWPSDIVQRWIETGNPPEILGDLSDVQIAGSTACTVTRYAENMVRKAEAASAAARYAGLAHSKAFDELARDHARQALVETEPVEQAEIEPVEQALVEIESVEHI